VKDGPEEYEDVCYQLLMYKVMEEEVTTPVICDTPWKSTSTTNLKIFRGRLRRNEFFAATNGRNMEMKAEPCKLVTDYFRAWSSKSVPTLYLDKRWIESEEDRALSLLFEMLQSIYDHRPLTVNKKNTILLNEDIEDCSPAPAELVTTEHGEVVPVGTPCI